MRRTVAVTILALLIGHLFVAHGPAMAYNGPAMKVTANQPGSTGYANRDLGYAVDASASTCATIGTYGAWAEWQFADGQPRFVTRVRLVVGEIHSPTIRVSGPEGTYQVPASTLELKFPEPTPILGFRVQSPSSGLTQSICDVQFDFVTVDPPGIVVNLRPVTVDIRGVTLAWEPPAAGGPVTTYQVLRDGQLIAETGDTTYTDELVEPLAQYVYAVQAVGPGGTGPAETVTVSVPELPTEPPGAVQSLRARVGARTVELVWSRPETGGRPREYRVYRDDSLLGTTPETSWRDATVEPESEYVYAVVPVNEAGPGETTTVVVRTPSPGLLDGAGPGVFGLGPHVGAGLGMLFPPFLVAAGLLLARVIMDRGMGWLGGWRRV